MQTAKLDAVEEELSRFQKALKAIRKEQNDQLVRARLRNTPVKDGAMSEVEYATRFISAPRLTGSLKRSSMDLTRALAELRKP